MKRKLEKMLSLILAAALSMTLFAPGAAAVSKIGRAHV